MIRQRRFTLNSNTPNTIPNGNDIERGTRRSTRLSNTPQTKTKRTHESLLNSKILKPKRPSTHPSLKVFPSVHEANPTKLTKVDTNQSSHVEKATDSTASTLVGREKERNFIQMFIQNCMNKHENGSLYISGSPGTGKTAVVLHETTSFASMKNVRILMLNCMRLGAASQVYTHLHSMLKYADKIGGKENCVPQMTHAAVESTLNGLPKSTTVLLILDEVDQLSSKSQDILYRLFDWPATLSCHLILIGIANALDLPERMLPRLQCKAHQPLHLTFNPYTRTELADIVRATLAGIDGSSLLDPLAIQLCVRKISATTGDVRTALSVCRRAIDIAHQEAQYNLQSPAAVHNEPQLTAHPTLKHISVALNESKVYSMPPIVNSTPVNQSSVAPITPQRSAGDLPLHHKLLIASCYLLRKQHKLREITFTRLYETYTSICKQRQLIGLDESELITVCGLMDARGYVHFNAPSSSKGSMTNKLGGTPARLKSIRLCLDDRGVEQTFADDLLLSTVLRMPIPL